ncbi:MAG: hypothetical protein WB998_10515 [Solirubrobacteraceae bacterium]
MGIDAGDSLALGARAKTRREDALLLAEELLSDIELARIEPTAVIRKTSRLARLLDDADAMAWLSYETTGYPEKMLDEAASAAARRSQRMKETDEGPRADCTLIGELAVAVTAAETDLAADSGGTSSSDYAVLVERNKAQRRNSLVQTIRENQSILDRVVGAVHQYVADRYQELRFGSAVETAFTVIRQEVDGKIAALIPDTLPMLSAAFENASSDNPEHWQSAAGTCRRLLMTAADRLRPPGSDVKGRKMGKGHYVNRLVDWIANHATSETAADMVVADLEYLGRRLDAADGAGQKGAHVGDKPVTRVEASRFVTGTYLVLGDILELSDGESREAEAGVVASAGPADPAES